ncbi:cupin domain-containing protein [Nesterenkonia lutea]|uniref:Quercetin dioxygenase-like cupin family protein n=1 Tax=Nesterenkonia lutea TaxID=272919 RepID=A0ABR9JGB9_9MICC|nr:cupin domain-containing protein [Nesterenkonia lutea]MBE1524977.1 quercetin dioxygenase-like cupin family protein [Nesterenkonia lutea]
MTLTAGEKLSEHENPGEATIQVLEGRVELHGGGASWNGSVGDLITVPAGLHSLDAVEDSAFLLTVVKQL